VWKPRPLGGRGFARKFAARDESLEFGGAGSPSWQSHIREACTRHDIALRPRSAIVERRGIATERCTRMRPASPPNALPSTAHDPTDGDSLRLKAGHNADAADRR
jgi:hypothetical protein